MQFNLGYKVMHLAKSNKSMSYMINVMALGNEEEQRDTDVQVHRS